MPNELIDSENLESLEKYRSYTRYLKKAEEEKNASVWWKTYRKHVEDRDPEHGRRPVVDILIMYLLNGNSSSSS